MGLSRHRYRLHHHHIVAALTFLLFTSASARTLSQLEIGFREKEGSKKINGSGASDRFSARKQHGGPGSRPPSCRSNCGSCSPCKPVHVPIQPGLLMPLEYYPEAWCCKCGDKIFMP